MSLASCSRRRFLQWSAAGAGLALLGARPSGDPAAAPKRILILGGTGFIGPAVVRAAQARGHHVTLFNRGKTRPGLFPGVEARLGDRDPDKGGGLKALETGAWDSVVDISGYYPRMVGASARLLAKRVKQYVYLSSKYAYKNPTPPNADESAPLMDIADPKVEELLSFDVYGGLKVLCEKAVESAMPGRATLVRAGYVSGPEDWTGNWTYWPVHFLKGGEIALPGAATDPFQIIDARDLAEWLVLVIENGTVGPVNADGKSAPWGHVIAACEKIEPAAKRTLTWIPADFVAKQNVLFPIWRPDEGATKGFHTRSIARALEAGLKLRPVDETVRDTVAWYKSLPETDLDKLKLEGTLHGMVSITPAQETAMLAAWKASKAK